MKIFVVECLLYETLSHKKERIERVLLISKGQNMYYEMIHVKKEDGIVKPNEAELFVEGYIRNNIYKDDTLYRFFLDSKGITPLERLSDNICDDESIICIRLMAEES